MKISSILVALGFAGAALAPRVARADIPPGDDYVEDCTMEKMKGAKEECISRGSWHGDKGAGASYLAELGFCKRCQTYGASAWSEIHCRPIEGAKPLPATFQADLDQLKMSEEGAEPSKPTEPQCSAAPPDAPGPAAKGPRAGCGCALADPPSAAAILAGLAFAGAAVARRRQRTSGARGRC